jgi:dUTP pyrophosphatase
MIKPRLKIKKLCNVKTPIRATKYSGCLDFYIPEYDEGLVDTLNKQNGVLVDKEKNTIQLAPHGKVLIPSGLKVHFSKKYRLVFKNKSGIAFKLQLLIGACVVESDYREEVFYNLINTSSKEQTIQFGQKIIQGELEPILYSKIIECKTETELFGKSKSNRKGGFGSTGLK